MRQLIKSALVQIMACCLLGAKPLFKPMLGIVKWTPRNKLQWNFYQDKKFYPKNAFQYIICDMTAILSKGRWVNSSLMHSYSKHFICYIFLVIQIASIGTKIFSLSAHHFDTAFPPLPALCMRDSCVGDSSCLYSVFCSAARALCLLDNTNCQPYSQWLHQSWAGWEAIDCFTVWSWWLGVDCLFCMRQDFQCSQISSKYALGWTQKSW